MAVRGPDEAMTRQKRGCSKTEAGWLVVTLHLVLATVPRTNPEPAMRPCYSHSGPPVGKITEPCEKHAPCCVPVISSHLGMRHLQQIAVRHLVECIGKAL